MELRRLHIGGEEVKDGWELLNIKEVEGVDYKYDAADLSRLGKQTYDEVYASHVLEHFDYAGAIFNALKQWRRVLKWGGKLYISVPDMDILCRSFVGADVKTQFEIMRIIFGGHTDRYDYHLVGLNFNLLSDLLTRAGFSDIERVKEFGIFKDCSSMPISLNVTARKIRNDKSI